MSFVRTVKHAAIAAAAITLFAAGSASAFSTYPAGGGSFASDGQGWQDQDHSCLLLGILTPGCTVTNEWTGSRGNPPGALEARYQPLAGVLNLITGRSVWRSPNFTLGGAPGPITGGTVSFDRAADLQALLDIGGSASTQVLLVDESPDPDVTTQVLAPDPITPGSGLTLNEAKTTFQRRTVSVPAAQLKAGDQYHLELVTTFQSLLQAANGNIAVDYDNVRLAVDDGTDTGQVAPFVATLNATSLTDRTAVLNALVNPKGLSTQLGFEVATDANGPWTGTAAQDVGDGTAARERSQSIFGLDKCTRYFFRARATNSIGTSTGDVLSFTTDCAPIVRTLPVAPISAQGAVLNGSVTPNGPETTYYYDYGTTAAYGNRTRLLSAGTGREAKQPLSEPVTGLTPETTYHVRIVADNALGHAEGNDVTFVTPPLTGPAGSNGTNGGNGVNGTPGTAGTAGTPGAPGPKGTLVAGSGNQVLLNGDARGLLIIRSGLVKVGTAGRRAAQVRLPIFCKKETGRSCAGTVKLRTIGLINPSTTGRNKAKRRVTIGTFEYQLAAGKKGYAIATIQPEKVDLMRRVKSIAITISVQVTDANNNRQTIVRKARMIARKTV